MTDRERAEIHSRNAKEAARIAELLRIGYLRDYVWHVEGNGWLSYEVGGIEYRIVISSGEAQP